jgi:DNA invertase Pin-like site-specific DNA recombinase
MGEQSKIKATHLARIAVNYQRQSTEEQVVANTGSTERQRNQAQKAVELGWPPERVEDRAGDLGLSGSAAEHRPEYLKILREMQEGVIGAVLMSAQDRLGRNASEWYRFLDLCRAYDVLVIVDGRVYDPNDRGDLLLLRIMATIAEDENISRRETMNRARQAKAAAGHAVSPPPNGYVRLQDGSWVKDPDPAVQASIATVFRLFPALRSCRLTVIELKRLGVRLPRRRTFEVRWAEPQVGTIYHMLTNPAFKGAYHYGRRFSDPRAGRNPKGHYRQRWNPAERVVVIDDHHEPYVDPREWDRIQAYLALNGRSKSHHNLGPGTALLQGLVRCGLHRNRRMSAIYKKLRLDGGRFHTYFCQGEHWLGGTQCGWIAGEPVDAVVVDAMFAHVAQPSLDAIRDGMRRARAGLQSEEERRRLELERARQNVAKLEEFYLSADPSNRQVTASLEARLEEAKRDLLRLERMRASARSPLEVFDDGAFDELVDLLRDFRSLWNAPTTTNIDRKQIIRTMVKEVRMEHREDDTVRVRIVWKDNSPSTVVEACRTRTGLAKRLITELAAEGASFEAIADRLKALGFLTHRGNRWTPTTVKAKLRNMRKRESGSENDGERDAG